MQNTEHRTQFDLGLNLTVVYRADLATYISLPPESHGAIADAMAEHQVPLKPKNEPFYDYAFRIMDKNLRLTCGVNLVIFDKLVPTKSEAFKNTTGQDLSVEEALQHVHTLLLDLYEEVQKLNAQGKNKKFEIHFAVARSTDARRIQIYIFAVDHNGPGEVPEDRIPTLFKPLCLVEQHIDENAYSVDSILQLIANRSDVKLSVKYQPHMIIGQNYFKVEQRGSQPQVEWVKAVKEQLRPFYGCELQEIPSSKDQVRRFLVVDPQQINEAGNAEVVATVDLTFGAQTNQTLAPKNEKSRATQDSGSTLTTEIPPDLDKILERWAQDHRLTAEKYRPVIRKLLEVNVTTQEIRDYFNAIQFGRLNLLKQFENLVRLRQMGKPHTVLVDAMRSGTDLVTLN